MLAHQIPIPSPIEESEDFDVLGDLENFTIARTRTPLSGNVKIWMFWDGMKIFYEASSLHQTPSPSGKVKIWMFWEI